MAFKQVIEMRINKVEVILYSPPPNLMNILSSTDHEFLKI